jgi:hypothetical protein
VKHRQHEGDGSYAIKPGDQKPVRPGMTGSRLDVNSRNPAHITSAAKKVIPPRVATTDQASPWDSLISGMSTVSDQPANAVISNPLRWSAACWIWSAWLGLCL